MATPTKQQQKPTPAPPRERMVRAAADLLTSGGRGAVSTRAVSAAADVQAPAIYRQFGDLDGLLQAAAHEVFRDYVRAKATRQPLADPIEDLRRGWDQHIAFGLAHPAAFVLLYTDSDDDDDDDDGDDDAIRDGQSILRGLIERVATAGLLRVTVDHAVALFQAAGAGAAISLIGTAPALRDLRVSADLRDATIAAITVSTASPSMTSSPAARLASRAMALRAVLDEGPEVLSSGERQLLGEWLDRLARG